MWQMRKGPVSRMPFIFAFLLLLLAIGGFLQAMVAFRERRDWELIEKEIIEPARIAGEKQAAHLVARISHIQPPPDPDFTRMINYFKSSNLATSAQWITLTDLQITD